MDEAIAGFCAITGASDQVGRHFLTMTDGDPQQAIQLYFDNPELGSALEQEATQPPPVPTATRPPARNVSVGHTDAEGVIHLDSDDDDDVSMTVDDDTPGSNPATIPLNNATYEDDEAMARRMQEELYASGDSRGGFDEEVRAPIARTTETLVGPDADWQTGDVHEAVLDQLRARQQSRRQGRPGVFNQRSVSSSVWDEADPDARREGLAEATGGASESSSKAAKLAELFRPPFELIFRLPWDEAREQGKEEEKWILVNVQDPSIFDCQSLNRDIWKHEGIKETVKENFIFMQYNKDDPRGNQYIQYYFPLKDSEAAYPHIAIVDPRTGEQVKVWSGPPPPKPMDFLMQLHEFLDRYSLNVAAKNPVAKRKPEKSAALDVDKMTEEQMLDLAMQNSLANGNNGPRDSDPDDLTKSIGDIRDLGKGKGKASEEEEAAVTKENGNGHAEPAVSSAFDAITSDRPHQEPENNSATTTRIQFRYFSGRVIRRFNLGDPVRRIYEWLKADPIPDAPSAEFELKIMGKDLIPLLDQTIEEAGLKNGTVMVEYVVD